MDAIGIGARRNVLTLADVIERLLRDADDYETEKKIDDLVFCVEEHILTMEEALQLAVRYI